MSDYVNQHQHCWDRIEKLAYLAAGLRREHHAQCGTSEHVTCFRCVAIEEYEMDRLERAVVRDRIVADHRNAAAIQTDAQEAQRRFDEAMRQHPSNGIEAVTDEILNYRPKIDPDHA